MSLSFVSCNSSCFFVLFPQTIMPGCRLSNAPPCRIFPSVLSLILYAWIMMVRILLKAVLFCLLSGFLVCWCRFHLTSIKLCIGWVLWRSLRDSGFDTALRYMADCRSRDIDWPRCRSSWIPYDFRKGEVADVPSCSASLTRCRNADAEPIGVCILPASPDFLVPEDLTLLPTNHARALPWLAECYLSEVADSDGPSEVP